MQFLITLNFLVEASRSGGGEAPGFGCGT